jgi:hypothetical protein
MEQNKEPKMILKERYRQICEQLDKLPSITKTPFKTNGKPNSNYDSIKNIFDIGTLIEIHSHILGRKNAYDNSLKELSVTFEPYKYLGYSAEDWNHDFKLQIEISQNQTLRKILTNQKQKIEPFVDNEDKILELLKELEEDNNNFSEPVRHPFSEK